MKYVTLKNDLPIQGYYTLKAGTRLKVNKYNSRYIYVDIDSHCTLTLTYKDITQKRPKTKKAV